MKLKNAFLALGVCSLLGVPAVAQAGTTASESIGKIATVSNEAARASTDVKKKKKDAGDVGLGVAAVAAAGVGIYFAVDDKNSTPGS